MKVVDTVAPVAAVVDAEAAKAPLVGPGTHGIWMDPQEPRRLRDGESRGLSLSGRVGPLETEEVVIRLAPDARQTSQNLP
jgi:hypothetical protein